MAKFVLFLILLVPLTFAGEWLMQHPGEVTIEWMDYQIQIHTALAAFALLVFYLLALAVALGLWQLANWPHRRRARRRYRTLARGLQQITHGMTALALGDESGAETALKKARAMLPGEPLPQLLTAQLLQRQGKQDAARSHFRALLAHPSTAQLATHRLIEQHLARHEWAEAAALAEEARADSPRERWLALTLIDLAARMGDTKRMLALTEGWHWQSPLTRDERHRYAAIAYFLAAVDEAPRQRQQSLRHAYGYAPQFLPATIAYAESLIAADELRRARKILLQAWETLPAVILIAPILQSFGDTTPRQQQRLLKPFLKGDSAARHLLEAQQAIDVDDYARAEETATRALAIAESRLGGSLMAEAEKQLHGAEAGAAWLARAMDAPAPSAWICQRCGSSHVVWQPHCHGCETFDSLRYEAPEARITSVELAVQES